MADHNQDSDCTVDNGACTVCGVSHGCPCKDCGGIGFHEENCSEAGLVDDSERERKRLQELFPVGARVRIIDSDLFAYIGLTGTVADYSIHSFPDELPLVGVQFDAPVVYPEPPYRDLVTRDGFYGDELALLQADVPVTAAAKHARLLAEKVAAYEVFDAAVRASTEAQRQVIVTRDAYLAAAERADRALASGPALDPAARARRRDQA